MLNFNGDVIVERVIQEQRPKKTGGTYPHNEIIAYAPTGFTQQGSPQTYRYSLKLGKKVVESFPLNQLAAGTTITVEGYVPTTQAQSKTNPGEILTFTNLAVTKLQQSALAAPAHVPQSAPVAPPSLQQQNAIPTVPLGQPVANPVGAVPLGGTLDEIPFGPVEF